MKDREKSATYGTKVGNPILEFNPTGSSKAKGKYKHRPGITFSRGFKLRKHRQREGSSRVTTYSFDEMQGNVFVIHLKGSHWGSTTPPNSLEPEVPYFFQNPQYFIQDNDTNVCVYDYETPHKVAALINKYEAESFTKWKRFRGVGFDKGKSKSKSAYNLSVFSADKLLYFGAELLTKLKTKGPINQHSKVLYFPGIGVCLKLKQASMACYRGFIGGHSLNERKMFTKASGCKALLNIVFWGVIDVPNMKITRIVTELVYPEKKAHNHSLDQFSISATDTYPKLKAFIEKCVKSGMGHQNTFIQLRKYAREELIPEIEKDIGKKINQSDTRF